MLETKHEIILQEIKKDIAIIAELQLQVRKRMANHPIACIEITIDELYITNSHTHCNCMFKGN